MGVCFWNFPEMNFSRGWCFWNFPVGHKEDTKNGAPVRFPPAARSPDHPHPVVPCHRIESKMQIAPGRPDRGPGQDGPQVLKEKPQPIKAGAK